ncbi:phosphomevalonate kinase [Paramarasmius palmivorus]|uniref:Phosphomevalonate kinase n=1 Tax=Paramarasmius palmivorus TaxID=297713 RepID=A0AAW0D7K1_9AGAR
MERNRQKEHGTSCYVVTFIRDVRREFGGGVTKRGGEVAGVPAAEWSTTTSDEITQTFVQAHEITQTIRALMRKMSTATSVPIEPAEQTRHLDACLGQQGVLGWRCSWWYALFLLTNKPQLLNTNTHSWGLRRRRLKRCGIEA